MKEYKKKLMKKNRLSRRVKFVLMNLSHYSFRQHLIRQHNFRQHLINKSSEYGCKVIVVTEEYTSQTCTNCGIISKKFEKRIKVCPNCCYKLNRDTTGSRNIYIKNINKLIKK